MVFDHGQALRLRLARMLLEVAEPRPRPADRRRCRLGRTSSTGRGWARRPGRSPSTARAGGAGSPGSCARPDAGLRGLGQRDCLGQQLLAQLVGALALVASELARLRQRGLDLGLELGRDMAAMLLERGAQGRDQLGRGLVVAFGQVLLQRGQRGADGFGRLGLQLGQLGRIELDRGGRRSNGSGDQRDLTARQAQLVGPDRDRGQRRLGILGGGGGLLEGGAEGFPVVAGLIPDRGQPDLQRGADAGGPVGLAAGGTGLLGAF